MFRFLLFLFELDQSTDLALLPFSFPPFSVDEIGNVKIVIGTDEGPPPLLSHFSCGLAE